MMRTRWLRTPAARDRVLWGAMLLLLAAFTVVLFIAPSAVGRGGR